MAGLKVQNYYKSRLFPKLDVFKKFELKNVHCRILNSNSEVVFEKPDVIAPVAWSQTAVEIAAHKYFHKSEKSILQMVKRVTQAISKSGVKQKYFDRKNANIFEQELAYILLSQKAAFNSPVWFNCGIEKSPQTSACFILSIEDSLDGIFDLLKTEAKLFKFGSGSGVNFSALRSKYENLARGGTSSGLISFLEVFDKAAGSIKSGGVTRRAAKMVCLNVDHPEIEEFVNWKKNEEIKAKKLIDAGYSGGFEGEAYKSVSGQNSNNSIRVTNSFLNAVVNNQEWNLKSRTSNKILKTVNAQKIWKNISEAAWECADPGLQFHDEINKWHTCKNSGEINASNPCSEYMFLDNTACNLSSINLVKFFDGSKFDWEAFRHTINILIIAQDILVDYSSYPTKVIEKNSKEYRPLGLGFANLGALIMQMGLAYDSDEGRLWGAQVSSVLSGVAYLQSTQIAKLKSAFKHFKKNKSSFIKVLKMHQKAQQMLPKLNHFNFQEGFDLGNQAWKKLIFDANKKGVRNAQISAIAPTGTIGLMMDCDTLGIEPEYSLIKYKKLSGGGDLTLVNLGVKSALEKLGYSREEIDQIERYLIKNNTLEGSILKQVHQQIFECASSGGGLRTISVDGHLKMMAAVQPFISGAISKTVNMPSDIKPEDIADAYFKAWKLGLKAISIYRDLSKGYQPLNSKKQDVQDPWSKCPECGSALELTSGCYKCNNCGTTLGCA